MCVAIQSSVSLRHERTKCLKIGALISMHFEKKQTNKSFVFFRNYCEAFKNYWTFFFLDFSIYWLLVIEQPTVK